MKRVNKIFIALFMVLLFILKEPITIWCSYYNGDTIETNEEGETVVQEMTEEQQTATEEFIDSTEITDNFVVYAEEFSQNGHLDGNMCVEELTTDTETTHYDWNNETQSLDIYTANDQVEAIKNSGQGNETVYDEEGDELGDYSIVLDGNDIKVGVIEGGEILVGDNISVQNVNDSSTFQAVELTGQSKEEVGNTVASTIVAIEENKKEMTEEEKAVMYNRIVEEVKIDENLNKIGQSGAALMTAFENDNPAAAADYTKYQLLPSFDSDTTVVFTVLPSDLESQDFANAINNLLVANASVGAKIILNVSTNGEESLTIKHPINGNNAYDISTGYLVWNFGDYTGNISYSFTTEGEIVAPNAIVDFNVMDGKIIAKEVKQNPGQEIHMPYTTEKEEKPEVPEPPKPEEPEPPKPDEPTPPKPDVPEPPTPDKPVPDEPIPPIPDEPEPTPDKPIPPVPESPESVVPVLPTPVIPVPPTPVVPDSPESATYIPDEPVPTAPVGLEESRTEELELPGVLGLRRGKTTEKAVLGERRGPETGDTSVFAFYIILLFISLTAIIVVVNRKLSFQ